MDVSSLVIVQLEERDGEQFHVSGDNMDPQECGEWHEHVAIQERRWTSSTRYACVPDRVPPTRPLRYDAFQSLHSCLQTLQMRRDGWTGRHLAHWLAMRVYDGREQDGQEIHRGQCTPNPAPSLHPRFYLQPQTKAQTRDITSNIHFSMARTQSKKRRLFGFAKTSNSTSGLTTSPGRSETRAGDFASISETPNMVSGRLAPARRFFRRSNQGPSTTTATEITDTQVGVGAQVAPDQEAAAASTGGGAQDQQEQPQAAPAYHVEKSVAKPEPEPKPEPKLDPKPKPEPEPTPASAGQHVDAAIKGFGNMPSVSSIPQFPIFKP
ncbi:hypothetical protein EDD16DRAFT_1516621 [Pisolithus croceorrhizus]|nr:hypothetical protein EDD16DRAFT_1516621 [Pisolithus croceorrhizus]